MRTWAEQRATDHVPEVSARTIKMLLRSEDRTVGALLNAKSAAQVRSVVAASLRRADLQDIAHAVEAVQGSTAPLRMKQKQKAPTQEQRRKRRQKYMGKGCARP